MSEELLIKALDQHTTNRLNDGKGRAPTVRQYYGTWASAEAGDANLSQVILQGGTWCRYVPKLAHVTGLTAGKTVLLQATPGVPLHITGVLVGDITVASMGTSDTEPPSAPGTLVAGDADTTSQPLSWGAATDNVGVSAYDVFVDDIYRMSVVGLSATVTGLTPGTAYDYKVRARDAAGNIGGFSNEVTASTDTEAPDPPDTLYVRQYAATWSGTYGYNGGNESNTWYGNEAHQGQYDGGNKKSLIGGFTTSTVGTSMTSDVTGASPVGARIRLTYFYWWANAGGTAVIGTHNNFSKPGTFTGTNTGRTQSGGWGRGVTRWVDLGAGICNEFITGITAGIALGPGPSSSVTYYGKAYGAGSGVYVPLLELTYTK